MGARRVCGLALLEVTCLVGGESSCFQWVNLYLVPATNREVKYQPIKTQAGFFIRNDELEAERSVAIFALVLRPESHRGKFKFPLASS